MERRTLPGGPAPTPYWHRTQSLGRAQRLFCPCGAVVYEGPKIDFSRVSCPRCKQVMDVPRELRTDR